MTSSSVIPTSLRLPLTRLKRRMSPFKQISPTRQNAVCNFVISSCVFSLLMHSSVGVNWSRFVLHQSAATNVDGVVWKHQNEASASNAINTLSETKSVERRILFGIWKYCETDDVGLIIGCDRSSYLLGVPKHKNLLMPDWLILSWVFIFGALVISIMAVVTAFAAIFAHTVENLFWSVIFHGFVTFFTLSMMIMYIFKEMDFRNILEDDDGAVIGKSEILLAFTEHYETEFYLVLLAGILSFLHLLKTFLRIKNVEKFIVFY